MAHKIDPLKGLNPDQSGPKEKIQNGDPNAGPERDQRSGAAEAGGPGPSLEQTQPNPDAGLVKSGPSKAEIMPDGVEGKPEKAGAADRSGEASYLPGEKLKDETD